MDRRTLLWGLGASLVPEVALGADRRPCGPLRYDRWTGHLERAHPEWVGTHGFVNYYGEGFTFDGQIQVAADSVPTCEVFGAVVSSLERPGQVRAHLADLTVDGRPASTDCVIWPSGSSDSLDRGVAELLGALSAAAPAPTSPPTLHLVPLGSHHSSSDVYAPAERSDRCKAVAVRVDGLSEIVLDRSEWKPAFLEARPQSRFARVGAGITVCHLNEALWELGLALETQGSFDGQSLAGAISTGTHGAGAENGAIADSVEAVVLVTCLRDPATGAGRWEVLQIEPDPDEAITDPAAFRTERAGVRWRLVQDSALFDAAVVGMGTLGVIAAYVVRVRPAYFLYEVRVGRPWSEVRANLVERATVPPNGFSPDGWRYEVAVNPSPVQLPEPDWVCTEVYRDAWQYDLDYQSQVREIPQKWVGGFTRSVNLGGQLGIYVGQAANRSMSRGKRVGAFADRCYRVLKLGQGEFVQAWGTELMVPAELGGELVDWILRTNVDRGELGFGARRGTRLLNPFGVRFARGRRGFLSPVRRWVGGRPTLTCTVELTEPVKNDPARNLGVRANGKPSSKAVVEAWAEDFTRTFGADGRLHWGQVQGAYGADAVERAYPDLGAFVDAFRTLNPFGLFDTTFARRIGLVARREALAGAPAPTYRGL